MATPNNFEVPRIVLHTYGDVISGDESGGAQYIAESKSLIVQLRVSDDLASLGLDHGWSVWVGCCKDAWVHVLKLTNDSSHMATSRSAPRF